MIKRTLEFFAGCLKISAAYKNPATHVFAVLRANKDRGHPECAGSVSDLLTSLERGLEEPEQGQPYTIEMLRALGAAANSVELRRTLVLLLASIFSMARAESFLTIRPLDVTTLEGRARVTLTNLKGKLRQATMQLEVERIGVFEPIDTPCGAVCLCPVQVFAELKESAGETEKVFSGGYASFAKKLWGAVSGS